MALRPDIILGARIANPAEAIFRGTTQGGQMYDTRRGIQQNRMLEEFGPGIYAGNEQALQQLARFDPGAALTIKRQHAAERRAQAAAARAAAASRRAAAEASQSAAKREELAREVALLRGVALARENGEEAFMQALNTSGLAQEGVTAQNFDMFLLTGEGAIKELGEAVQDARPEPYEPDWAFVPNSDGQVIDKNSPTVPQAVMIGQFSSRPDAKQKEIEQLAMSLQRQGMDPQAATERATGIVYGSLEPLETGGVLNMATGQVEGSQLIDQSLIPQPDQAQSGGLYDRADQATGLGPAAARGAADTLGQIPLVGGLFNFEDQVQAGQAYRQATGELVRALSINPRFPVAEMNRIRQEINIEPGILRDPDAMRSRMVELDRYLAGRARFEAEVANSSGVPMDQRLAAKEAFSNIERFRQILGVPSSTSGTTSGGIKWQIIEE